MLKTMEYFPEFTLYNMTSRQEYEANVILASIILDGGEFLQQMIEYDFDAYKVAQAMNTDINPIVIKCRRLAEMQGLSFRRLDVDSRFMK